MITSAALSGSWTASSDHGRGRRAARCARTTDSHSATNNAATSARAIVSAADDETSSPIAGASSASRRTPAARCSHSSIRCLHARRHCQRNSLVAASAHTTA